ncbi:MAG: hypothetical protein ACRCTZ_03030 [Sarcina sp.]
MEKDYVVIFNEDEIKWFDNREDAEEFVDELSQEELEEYCDEYEEDLDGISEERRSELLVGSGVEYGTIKILSIHEILGLIENSDICKDDKKELKYQLLHHKYTSISEYEKLVDVLY